MKEKTDSHDKTKESGTEHTSPEDFAETNQDNANPQSQHGRTAQEFIDEKVHTIKHKSPKELTVFDLTFLFATRFTLCKIHGILHYFNGKHYCPIDRQGLESKILEFLFDELDKRGDIRIISSIVYIIERMQLPDHEETSEWVGFENGILNIRGWSFVPYSEIFPRVSLSDNKFPQTVMPQDTPPDAPIITYNLRALYDVDGSFLGRRYPPESYRFFNEIAGGDAELVARIYEMIGYLLVPDTSAKVFFLLQGVPDSGKSVLGRFLEGFFPPQCVTALDISRLGGQFLPEALSTSRLNLSMDLPDGLLSKKAVATIKMLTGNDLITQEIKYKDAKPLRGQCKLLFSINGKLKMTGRDAAFLDRIVCIPFKHSVPKNLRDENLLQKLNAERDGITMIALQHYKALVSQNRVFSGGRNYLPDIEYRLAPNDTIKEFVSEVCDLQESAYTSTDDLYVAYLAFCNQNNLKAISSKSGFGQRLSGLYATQLTSFRKHTDKTDNMRGYYGIRLSTEFKSTKYDEANEDNYMNNDYIDDDEYPPYPDQE